MTGVLRDSLVKLMIRNFEGHSGFSSIFLQEGPLGKTLHSPSLVSENAGST